MSRQVLLIFTKNPELGKVKTRLAATIGSERALAVYKKLIDHTIAVTKSLPVDKIVFYSDHIEHEDGWDVRHYDKKIQKGSGLGERMNNAFGYAFQKGYDKVVIIGTDCPGVNTSIIMHAFAFLNDHNLVIGPSEDGGYYLLGMQQHYSSIFMNISWSTDAVFRETVANCEEYNISYSFLPLLHDVDEEKDLIHLTKVIV